MEYEYVFFYTNRFYFMYLVNCYRFCPTIDYHYSKLLVSMNNQVLGGVKPRLQGSASVVSKESIWLGLRELVDDCIRSGLAVLDTELRGAYGTRLRGVYTLCKFKFDVR